MGRKRALLLLMAVVLWTALPALACALPATQPACCHGMMQGCDDSAGMDAMSCCHASAPGQAVPPAATAPSTHILILTHIAPSWNALPPALVNGRSRATATSPSPPQSALSAILRI